MVVNPGISEIALPNPGIVFIEAAFKTSKVCSSVPVLKVENKIVIKITMSI